MSITRWPYYVPRPQDPDSTLDYQLDWSEWLDEGESIAESYWVVSPTGTISASGASTTLTYVWFSGGDPGSEITLTNTITTDLSPIPRIDSRSLIISIEER